MFSLQVLLLGTLGLAASIMPREPLRDTPDGYCCFTLNSNTSDAIVQQDTYYGNTYVSSTFSPGWYCLDLSDPNMALRDDYYNACFLTPAPAYQLVCLDPTISFINWSLKKDRNGDVYLKHDDSDGFKECAEKGTKGRVLYSDQHQAEKCQSIKLKAEGLTGTCGSL